MADGGAWQPSSSAPAAGDGSTSQPGVARPPGPAAKQVAPGPAQQAGGSVIAAGSVPLAPSASQGSLPRSHAPAGQASQAGPSVANSDSSQAPVRTGQADLAPKGAPAPPSASVVTARLSSHEALPAPSSAPAAVVGASAYAQGGLRGQVDNGSLDLAAGSAKRPASEAMPEQPASKVQRADASLPAAQAVAAVHPGKQAAAALAGGDQPGTSAQPAPHASAAAQGVAAGQSSKATAVGPSQAGPSAAGPHSSAAVGQASPAQEQVEGALAGAAACATGPVLGAKLSPEEEEAMWQAALAAEAENDEVRPPRLVPSPVLHPPHIAGKTTGGLLHQWRPTRHSA